MNSPTVSVVIVTRNNRSDIGACLESLRVSRPRPGEVIIIDQASTDGTADYVRREYPDTIVLDFWDNPGFGEGNNRGIRVACGEYLFLLNPDATVAQDTLARLVGALEQDRRCGIAVPKTVLAGEPHIINSAGLLMNQIGYGWDRGYLEWDHGQFDRQEPVLAGSGCALVIRASVARQLGGFDAPYFLYYEDLDLCLRSWLAGIPVVFIPSAVVRHAMKVHSRPLWYGEYLDHRNRLRTLFKTLSAALLLRLMPAIAIFEVKSLLSLARRRQWRALRFRLGASFWNLWNLPSTLRQRRTVQRTRAVDDAVLQAMQVSGDGAPTIRAALPSYPPTYRHTLDPARLSARVTVGQNDSGALGLGWHGPEVMDGRSCRWSCGYGILFLRAPADAWSGSVRLSCRSTRPLDVVVKINDAAGYRFSLSGARWEEHTVAGTTQDEVIRVELFPQGTFVPSDGNPASADLRTLGVAVAAVSIV